MKFDRLLSRRSGALVAGFLLLLLTCPALAQITVQTNGSASVSYPLFSQSAGPFPWTDVGVKVGAAVTPGFLNATVGGATAYNFNSTLTANQTFVPGNTVLNLGYNPSWTGSLQATSQGNLNSQLVYNIGPINGSVPIASVNLATGASGNLGSALNSNLTGLASGSVSTPTVTLSGTLEAPFDVARVTLSLGVAAQLKQTISWAPTVTYGDLVWYSTAQSYSALDNPTFVSGGAGSVLNTFMAPPASLGLASGDTFYMNMLPAVQLAMPVGNQADIGVPANLDINGQVFGSGFNYNFPLGNLYDLSSGTDTVNFNGTWYGGEFYSIPLQYTESCPIVGITCDSSFIYTGSGATPGNGNNGIPGNLLPPVNLIAGNWPDGVTGPGTTPTGPLFPNGNCSPDGGTCFTTLTYTPTPEPSTLVLLVSGAFACGGFIRRRRAG